MLKNRTIITVEVAGREYGLECAFESPLTDVAQAIELLKKYVNQRLIEASNPPQNKEEECHPKSSE